MTDFAYGIGYIMILENKNSLDERKRILEEIKKDDSISFKVFCEEWCETLKELGLSEFL